MWILQELLDEPSIAAALTAAQHRIVLTHMDLIGTWVSRAVIAGTWVTFFQECQQ